MEVKREDMETPPVEAGQPTEETIPVETPPVETPPEGEKPTEDKGKSGEPKDGKDKTSPGVQKRIDKIRREKGAAEREAQYLKGKVDVLEEQAKKALDRPVESPPKPVAEDYDDHEKFVDELTDWKLDERDRDKARKEKLLDDTPTQEKRTPQQEASREVMLDRIEVAKENHDDFEEVVFGGDEPLSMTPFMIESMESTETGAEILYHLGKNPDEAARIAKLSPMAQGMAIGQLESKISAPKTIKAPGAPEPITPIGGGGSSPTKDYDKMSMAEFMESRKDK